MQIGFHYQGQFYTAIIKKNKIDKVCIDNIEIKPDLVMKNIIKRKIRELNN